MARVDTLGNFLTDVADAIREKTGSEETIQASDFDTAISEIPEGADLSEYFNNTIKRGYQNLPPLGNIIKKIPPNIVIQGTSCAYMFSSLSITNIDISNLNTSNITDMEGMFYNSNQLLEIDMSMLDTRNVVNTYRMFYDNYISMSLTKIDMRNFDFTQLTNYNQMFGISGSSGPKDNCLIIVADATQKAWINTNFSRLTNVVTASEYEASLNS